MSLFAAWTDVDCYMTAPHMVSEEKWIECKQSRSKMNLIIAIVVVTIFVIIIIFVAPPLYAVISALIGVIIIGSSVFSLITVRAAAAAQHKIIMRPVIDIQKTKGITLEAAQREYAQYQAELRSKTQQVDAARITSEGNMAMMGMAAATAASIFSRKKEGGETFETECTN